MDYTLALDPQPFLSRHWQREHLFMPRGLEPFTVPADADELAGLAMEDGVDGRIIRGQERQWSSMRGPFSDNDFQCEGPWSLLVHGVDRYWDEASALLHAVPWLPRWRLDDVMMSYASDGGSAGPHFDNYDVFIIQGEGRRRWQIGDPCDNQSALLDAPDLRLLANFEARHEYIMECGDVLYIPPRCSHFGVSIGESTSFSIGFRAPRISDLLARWTDNRLEALDDDCLLKDAGRDEAPRAGEITASDLENARTQLRALLDDSDPRWFGEVLTGDPVSADGASVDSGSYDTGLAWATLSPGARLAWHNAGERVIVFSGGTSREFPIALQASLELLCGGHSVSLSELRSHSEVGSELLRWLVEEGTIELHDD